MGKPEKKFTAGAVQATVWKNTVQRDGNTNAFHSVSCDRRYKDRNGNWKSTGSLRVNDIPKALTVLQKAYEYMVVDDTSENVREPARKVNKQR